MLVNEPAEYPEPDNDNVSNDALPHEPERNKCTLPSAPPAQQAVLSCPLPGRIRHFKWWLRKWFPGLLGIFSMYAEMGSD